MEALLLVTRPWLAPAFVVWGSPVTWLEIAAFVLSIAMVLCNFRIHPLAWPLAIAASLLYAVLFVHSRLYGQAGLQLVFVAVAFWGWWQWLGGRGSHGGPLVVHRLAPRQRWQLAAATLAAWPLLALLLHHGTDSDVPLFDALPTVGSIAGQFLLARKVLENWVVWLAVNVASVALFAGQRLWLTVVLYAIFAALSVVGWHQWRRLEGRARG